MSWERSVTEAAAGVEVPACAARLVLSESLIGVFSVWPQELGSPAAATPFSLMPCVEDDGPEVASPAFVWGSGTCGWGGTMWCRTMRTADLRVPVC